MKKTVFATEGINLYACCMALVMMFLITFFSGCQDHRDPETPDSSLPTNVLYIENNVAVDNQNAILAYRRGGDGTLTALAGSPFATGGKGVSNPTQKLGPDDSDQCIAQSEDKKRLFAVNSGSNTIAVFNVAADGSLAPVTGSPFASGGINPTSVSVAGNKLYVVNKNDDPLQPNPAKPNYTVLTIETDGRLTPLAGSTIETAASVSPGQAHLAPGKRLLFGADFLAFMLPTPIGSLRAFTVGEDGKLAPTAGTPITISGMGGALGLWAHPLQNVLYVGHPLEGMIGVYSYDSNTGALTFQTKVMAGKAVCWLRVNKTGTRLYALVSGENRVAVYDLTNPLAPANVQFLDLKNSGPSYEVPMAGAFTTSEPFHEELSPDEKYLYVINQHTNPDFTISGNYNYLHTLVVGTNGQISEPGEPLQIPVDKTVRPQGIVVY
ncbi:lactonase family protein [Spirosoma pollinicola]|uniref:3-carboxymuconate cyclase n=1 Tax=Spirosoma pollinicola TaxID=2057025 RepID=A0A2K8Z0V1_9BACT|nr:beta-propeller fold lactonase family protein [Spirosoma pollinicola]AUD03491.1 hypothetical protein CWM47_17635 [Spirosoma pollinicola]